MTTKALTHCCKQIGTEIEIEILTGSNKGETLSIGLHDSVLDTITHGLLSHG